MTYIPHTTRLSRREGRHWSTRTLLLPFQKAHVRGHPKGVYRNGDANVLIDGRIAPRSGLASKNFIDTGAGVIDADYRGQVKVLLFNHAETDFMIKMGDRVAQLVLERVRAPMLASLGGSFHRRSQANRPFAPRSIRRKSSKSRTSKRVRGVRVGLAVQGRRPNIAKDPTRQAYTQRSARDD